MAIVQTKKLAKVGNSALYSRRNPSGWWRKAGHSRYLFSGGSNASMRSDLDGYDLYPSLMEKTAIVIHTLIMNHPFIDANIRTAFLVGARFLHEHGMLIDAGDDEIVDLCLGISQSKIAVPDIALWLEHHTVSQEE